MMFDKLFNKLFNDKIQLNLNQPAITSNPLIPSHILLLNGNDYNNPSEGDITNYTHIII